MEKEKNSSVRIRISAGLLCGLIILMHLCGCGRNETVYDLAKSISKEDTFQNTEPEEVSDQETVSEGKAEEPEEPKMLFVYVCGAVNSPGVYQLPNGSRVYDALEAAGGLTSEAEARSLNQARTLSDGEQITVYTTEEVASGLAGQYDGATGNLVKPDEKGSGQKKVNLNTATQEELMTLPGIGEAKSKAILEYREQNGPFSSIEEIQNISGIKEKAFAQLKELIEV